jgi:hypothetical protein
MGPTIGAETRPTVGIVYNTTEAHALTYECRDADSGAIECDFTQTSVWKKAEPEDLSRNLTAARSDWRQGGGRESAADCKSAAHARDVLEGRVEAQASDFYARQPQADKTQALKAAKLLISLCERPTEETYLELVRASYEQDSRTCRVRSNPFTQRFVPARDETGGTSSWIADSKPEGDCGVVQLSRFVRDAVDGYVFWKYIARKAVTNPKATFLTSGKTCGEVISEVEYVYDWRQRTLDLGCDFIDFSP